MTIDVEDLFNPPVLDPRNAASLTSEARTLALQSGIITNILENDPIDVLIRTQSYVGAELLYYLNKLPLALLVKFLEQTKVLQTEPQRAVYTQEFLLSTGRPSYTIPQGFEVRTSSGLRYLVVEDIVFEAFADVATGLVEAIEPGSAYNVPLQTINVAPVSLAFLRQVRNIEQVISGTDETSQEQTLERQLKRLGTRAPITQSDYELFATDLMGVGSEALAIGRLGGDASTEELGAVHLFLLNSSKLPATAATVATVRSTLQQFIQVSTRLYVSPMEILYVNVEANVGVKDGFSISQVANDMNSAFVAYMDAFTAGKTLFPDDIYFVLRGVSGLDFVEEVEVNGDKLPIVPPTAFTRCVYGTLTLNIISDQAVTVLAFGPGDED